MLKKLLLIFSFLLPLSYAETPPLKSLVLEFTADKRYQQVPFVKDLFDRVAEEILIRGAKVFEEKGDLKEQALLLVEASQIYQSEEAKNLLKALKQTSKGIEAARQAEKSMESGQNSEFHKSLFRISQNLVSDLVDIALQFQEEKARIAVVYFLEAKTFKIEDPQLDILEEKLRSNPKAKGSLREYENSRGVRKSIKLPKQLTNILAYRQKFIEGLVIELNAEGLSLHNLGKGNLGFLFNELALEMELSYLRQIPIAEELFFQFAREALIRMGKKFGELGNLQLATLHHMEAYEIYRSQRGKEALDKLKESPEGQKVLEEVKASWSNTGQNSQMQKHLSEILQKTINRLISKTQELQETNPRLATVYALEAKSLDPKNSEVLDLLDKLSQTKIASELITNEKQKQPLQLPSFSKTTTVVQPLKSKGRATHSQTRSSAIKNAQGKVKELINNALKGNPLTLESKPGYEFETRVSYQKEFINNLARDFYEKGISLYSNPGPREYSLAFGEMVLKMLVNSTEDFPDNKIEEFLKSQQSSNFIKRIFREPVPEEEVSRKDSIKNAEAACKGSVEKRPGFFARLFGRN